MSKLYFVQSSLFHTDASGKKYRAAIYDKAINPTGREDFFSRIPKDKYVPGDYICLECGGVYRILSVDTERYYEFDQRLILLRVAGLPPVRDLYKEACVIAKRINELIEKGYIVFCYNLLIHRATINPSLKDVDLHGTYPNGQQTIQILYDACKEQSYYDETRQHINVYEKSDITVQDYAQNVTHEETLRKIQR